MRYPSEVVNVVKDGVFAVAVQRVKSGGSLAAREAREMMAFVEQLSDPAALRECNAQAAAVVAYLSQRRDVHVEEHNSAIKVKAKVEHRLGEVLAQTVNHKGSRGVGNTVLPTKPPEITKMQSSRAQQMAKVPWEDIEAAIDQRTEEGKKASPTRIVKAILNPDGDCKVSGSGNGSTRVQVQKGDAAEQLLRWACRRESFNRKDVADHFSGLNTANLCELLSTLARGSGFIVTLLDRGEYRVRKAVHFAWKDQEADHPGIKDAMAELHRLAHKGLQEDLALSSASWTRADRTAFLHEVLKITGQFVKG